MRSSILKRAIYLIIIFNLFSCTTTFKDKVSDLVSADVEVYRYNNININYSDTGKGQPIVFVHGLGAYSFTWRHLLKYFALEYRVISIDLMGFGDSDKPIDHSYLVSDQARIVSSFIIDKNLKDVILVGNSLGGTVSLFSYFSVQDRLSSLVLLDPALYPNDNIPTYISILQTPVLNKLALNLGSKDFLAKMALKNIVYDHSLITDEMIYSYGDKLKNNGTQNALIKSVKEDSFEEVDRMVANYERVDIPVLIIFGDKDRIINVNDGIRLNESLENSELVILKNCGHLPQEEAPEETINAINNFIQQIY